MKKKIGIGLSAIGLSLAACAGNIEWNTPQYVTGDADVCTNGALLYATCSAGEWDTLSVNGVTFTLSSDKHMSAVNTRDNIVFSSFTSWTNNLAASVALTETFTSAYRMMLSYPPYADGSDVTVTLRRLSPGRRYLVQLWSCSAIAEGFANETLTIDGAATLIQNPGEDGQLGQFVTGEFTATSDTQTFVASPTRFALINAIQVRDISATPVIRWEVHDIAADSDVITDGRLCFAYAQCGNSQNTTVNGVTFNGVKVNGPIPTSDTAATAMADILQEGFINSYPNVFAPNFTPAENMTSAYNGLVSGASYGYGGKGYVILRNLLPGHVYLVQIWINDGRAAGANRHATIDDSCLLRYNKGTFGQYAVGRFRAVTYDQRIELDAGSDADGDGGSIQWNAMQVRDVTAGVEWGEVVAIADETCVSTDGDLLYACSYAGSDVTVNGVTFKPAGKSILGMNNSTVSLTGFSVSHTGSETDFMTGGVAAGMPQELHDFLQHGVYSTHCRTTRMTLRQLVPGARYQVQLFAGDRRNYSKRGMIVDGVARMGLNNNSVYPFGCCVTGEFTAKSEEQDITLMTRPVEANARYNLCVVQAVQVRRLVPPSLDAGTGWEAFPVVSATDVSTQGTLCYAYNWNKSVTVNGVAFTKIDKFTASLGDGNVTLSGFSASSPSPFIPANDPLISELGTYSSLLLGGTYKDTATASMTLNNLTPGHIYLVQFWLADLRDYDSSRARYIVVDGEVTMHFPGPTGTGTYAIRTFAADSSSRTVNFACGADVNNNAWKSSQINALQVRDLGPVADALPESGTVTTALTGVGLVKNSSNELAIAAAAPNMTHVMLNDGTLVMSSPELLDNPLDVFVNEGATLTVPAGKSLVLSGLSGGGTIAADGATLVFTNAVEGIFGGSISGNVSVVKRGGWPAALGGDNSDALDLNVEGGVLQLFNGDRTGPLSLAVGTGAMVELDFAGTNDVTNATLGGRTAHGILSAGTRPQYVAGYGALRAPSIGIMIIIK